MMVVVADAILEARRGPERLNAPEQTLFDEHAEGVVDGLAGDGADLGPHHFGHGIGRDVGLGRYGSQDGQSLGRDLDTVLAEKIDRVGGHCRRRLDQSLD
jgi:hypothetical protein